MWSRSFRAQRWCWRNITNWNLLSEDGNVFDYSEVLKAILPYTFGTQPDLTVAMNNDLLDSATATSTNPTTIVYKIKVTMWAITATRKSTV